MDRRSFVATTILAGLGGCVGSGLGGGNGTRTMTETQTDTPTTTPIETPTETPTETAEEWKGWMHEDELEDGYTVIHISREWELVPAEETEHWNGDEIEKYRRGACKRYTVYESVPEGYNLYKQGLCEEGVTLSVEDDRGVTVAQIELPEKESAD